ncbi:MAG: hypothetical protein QOJ70_3545 [Acidobacteriota bacterium]|jgi:uncharacterized protein YecT (DUF1311 family)|nr:hypothetical protein [Acidobacteriota bacterium]
MKLTALFILLLFGAAAAEARGQSPEDPCAYAQRSPEQMACAEKELKDAEAELKRARARLAENMEARPLLRMRQAERAWLRYRKSNCDAEASIYEGGTIQPFIQTLCMARVTRARASELLVQLKTLIE